jgi:hypothetical protein
MASRVQYPIAEKREVRSGHDSSREPDTYKKTSISPFFDERYAGGPQIDSSTASQIWATS